MSNPKILVLTSAEHTDSFLVPPAVDHDMRPNTIPRLLEVLEMDLNDYAAIVVRQVPSTIQYKGPTTPGIIERLRSHFSGPIFASAKLAELRDMLTKKGATVVAKSDSELVQALRSHFAPPPSSQD